MVDDLAGVCGWAAAVFCGCLGSDVDEFAALALACAAASLLGALACPAPGAEVATLVVSDDCGEVPSASPVPDPDGVEGDAPCAVLLLGRASVGLVFFCVSSLEGTPAAVACGSPFGAKERGIATGLRSADLRNVFSSSSFTWSCV